MTKVHDQEPKFSEVYLKGFTQKNPHAEIIIEKGKLMIERPWARNDVRLVADIHDQKFIEGLNNLRFSPKFDALLHEDKNLIEFVYAFVNQDQNPILNRKFSIYFQENNYECYFAEPTDRLFTIAKSYQRIPTDEHISSVTQLIPFRDSQKINELDERIKGYFNGKVPRSFFVKCPGEMSDTNIELLSRHINFLMHYYDRSTPIIEINPDPIEDEHQVINPIRFIEGAFPESLLSHQVDDIVLKLMEVARSSSPRFSFLYYYQVLEYAGYYYIDETTKRSLRRFLKDPTLINCAEEKVSELFTIFSDLNHNDDVKIQKVIEEYCDPSVIWKEIENDKAFFSENLRFDGGFEINSLTSIDTTENSWRSMWMPKLYHHITKIRNSLVHAREKRENKVILPTNLNNQKLRHYIPVMKRVAEQIALKSA